MSKLIELLSQKSAIEAQIAAHKPEVVKQIKEMMFTNGIVLQDLGADPARGPSNKGDQPTRYRDSSGNTWCGLGKRPGWLRAALASGASIDSFRVA